MNDPELCFQEILRKKVSEPVDNKDAIKLESTGDILKFDKNEILVKLEKGEGTLKIEKVAIKKENAEEKEVEKKEENKVELTIVKTEAQTAEPVTKEAETEIPSEGKTSEEKEAEKVEKMETEDETEKKDSTESEEKKDAEETKPTEEKAPEAESIEKPKEVATKEASKDEETAEIKDPEKAATVEVKVEEKSDKIEDKNEGKESSEVKPKEETEKEKQKKEESDADLCSKQAAELKAMFPDLEVIQPSSRTTTETSLLKDKPASGALDFSETTVAQLLNNAVKWPKEYAIQVRLIHIIYAFESKEWPVSKTFSAYASGIGSEYDIPIHELPSDPVSKRETSTPMSVGDSELISITTDSYNRSINKKRKRHIAIDVETERAKLHALLNSTHGMQGTMGKPMTPWDNDDSEDSRRSTPVSQQMLQPPPAHQHTSSSRMLNMPYDLKYHVPPKTIGQTTVIPGTSSTLTPIDLSSG